MRQYGEALTRIDVAAGVDSELRWWDLECVSTREDRVDLQACTFNDAENTVPPMYNTRLPDRQPFGRPPHSEGRTTTVGSNRLYGCLQAFCFQ
jgi:hypothetical protein